VSVMRSEQYPKAKMGTCIFKYNRPNVLLFLNEPRNNIHA